MGVWAFRTRGLTICLSFNVPAVPLPRLRCFVLFAALCRTMRSAACLRAPGGTSSEEGAGGEVAMQALGVTQ